VNDVIGSLGIYHVDYSHGAIAEASPLNKPGFSAMLSVAGSEAHHMLGLLGCNAVFG
jgi:hypothetical protein